MLTKDLTTKTMSFAKGANYVGETWYGKKHGEGTMTWANGSKYAARERDGAPRSRGLSGQWSRRGGRGSTVMRR